VPAEVHSVPSFERWRREAEARDPALLRMRAEDLLRDDAERVDPHAFPRRIAVEALELPLAYAHDPEDAHDGVTARIPVEALAVLDPAPFEWLVPGLLAEKVEALVRSLPKHLRVRLFPIEEVVQGSVEALGLKDGFGKGSLKARLARHLAGIAQSPIAVDDFREDQLAPHLRMRFSIVDADGRVLGEGRDVAELARRFAAVARDRLRASVDRATDPIAKIERDRVERLPDEPIPASISYTRAGIGLRGYPALAVEAPEGEPVVALRVFDGEAEAIRAHAVATARLLAAEIREAVEHHVAYDPGCEALLALLAHSGEEDGVGFIARLVAAGAIGEADQPPRSARDAIECERLAADRLHDRVAFVMRAVARILETAGEVESRLRGVVASPSGDAKARIAHRLAEILGSHGLAALEGCDRDELSQRLRLAEMLLARLERLREIGSARDRAIDDELAPLAERVALALRDRSRTPAERRNIRRMWEEIEISRYAPKLPRAFPASERRLEELLGE
jgi:ATP-dependent helicase HrpA